MPPNRNNVELCNARIEECATILPSISTVSASHNMYDDMQEQIESLRRQVEALTAAARSSGVSFDRLAEEFSEAAKRWVNPAATTAEELIPLDEPQEADVAGVLFEE